MQKHNHEKTWSGSKGTMKAFFVVLPSILTVYSVAAYGRSFTVNDILTIAACHADEITLNDLRYREGIYQRNFYRSEALPMVNLEVSGGPSSRSLKSQQQGFSMGESGSGTGIPDSSALSDQIAGLLQTGNPADSVRAIARQEAWSATGQVLEGFADGFEFDDALTGIGVGWSLTAVQPLVTFGKVRSALRAAKIRNTMLDDAHQFELDTFFLGVLATYSTALSAQKQLEVTKKSLEGARKSADVMQINFETGALEKRTLLRIQAREAAAEADSIFATTNHRAAIRRLAVKIGLPPDSVFTLTPVEESSLLRESGTSVDAADGLPCILQEHWLELKKNETAYERAKLFPAIFLTGAVSNQLLFDDSEFSPEAVDIFHPDYMNYSIGLQLRWTLFDGLRTPSRYRQVLSQSRQQELQLRQFRKQAAVDVAEAAQSLTALQKSIEAVSLQRKAAGESYDIALRDFESGAVGITDLLEIEQEWIQAEKSHIDLITRYLLGTARLKLLVGEPVFSIQQRTQQNPETQRGAK